MITSIVMVVVVVLGVVLAKNDMLQTSGGFAAYYNWDTPKNVSFRKCFHIVSQDYTPDYTEYNELLEAATKRGEARKNTTKGQFIVKLAIAVVFNIALIAWVVNYAMQLRGQALL